MTNNFLSKSALELATTITLMSAAAPGISAATISE